MYTEYFSKAIHANGVPHLSLDQFVRMMNIVYLEGRIKQLGTSDVDKKNTLSRFNIEKQLKQLTGAKPANLLFEELVLLSETRY